MGFTVYYRTLAAVAPEKRASLEAACDELCRGHTWRSCEPVGFFGGDDDGHVMGGSKPSLGPNADDVVAESEGLPDGTIRDALDVLCRLSRDHGVDWEISHDYSEDPIGLIRAGQVDPQVLQQIERLTDVGDMLGARGADDTVGKPADDENDGPRLRLFQPDDD